MRESDREDRRILEIMKRDREIACLQFDKTGRIIIMNRKEYNCKMTRPLWKWVQRM